MSKKNTNTELKLSGRGKPRVPASLIDLNFPYFYPTLLAGVPVPMLADSGGAVLNIRLYLRDRTRVAVRLPLLVCGIENVTSVAVNGTCVKLTPDPAAPAPHAFLIMAQADGLVSADVTYAAVGAKVVTVIHPLDPSVFIQQSVTLA